MTRYVEVAKKSRRHGKAQIVPLLVLEGNQKPDSTEMKDMGTKSKNTKERLEVANEERRTHLVSGSHWTQSHLREM